MKSYLFYIFRFYLLSLVYIRLSYYLISINKGPFIVSLPGLCIILFNLILYKKEKGNLSKGYKIGRSIYIFILILMTAYFIYSSI